MLGEILVDFPMPWHRLRLPSFGIAIPVVAATVPHEDAPRFFEAADEVLPLHGTVISATLRIPGISPLVRS